MPLSLRELSRDEIFFGWTMKSKGQFMKGNTIIAKLNKLEVNTTGQHTKGNETPRRHIYDQEKKGQISQDTDSRK